MREKERSLRYENSEEIYYPMSDEFLEALLQEDVYPWNPSDPEAEAYFAEREQNFSLIDCLDSDEIEEQAEFFLAQLHQRWETKGTTLKESLLKRFSYVPSTWLDTIVRRAEQIVASNLSPVQQLIECVKPLLVDWTEADLQILARPLPYAIRSNYGFGQAKWNQLSSIDKARLSMAIAQYTLSQLKVEPK